MAEPELRAASDTKAGLPVDMLTSASRASPPLKFRFAHKVTLLSVVLICVSGVAITTLTGYRFRQEMYDREISSAFTVYTAVSSYLSGHYKSNNRYVPRSIDFVLKRRFLRAGTAREQLITHRPERVVIYDARGKVVCQFPEGGVRARNLPPELVPLNYGPAYDAGSRSIRIGGPVSPDGDVPGYVEIIFATSIREKTAHLFLQSFGIMFVVVLLAIGLSWIFARHVLAPIEALTLAASRVHGGELNQQVMVTTDDEIGVLATTFNVMVASLAKRITLLHRIQEWTVRIGRELESQRLYGALLAMFVKMAGAESCRLYVYDKEADSLAVRRGHGEKHLPEAGSDALSQRALAERWVQYQREDGAISGSPAGAVEIAIPLLSGERRIGVVRIGRNRDGAPYDDETVTILQTLAQHASVAMENAHLYGELAEKERIEQEMRWAREIQMSLLPQATPTLPGYEVCGVSMPAFEVGGDYFDYVATDGKWYFVVGDVSGKGVPAALIMSIIRSLIRTYAEFETSPREVLIKVDRKLCQDLDPEMFVTMALLCLDPVAHRVAVARAGHEPVLRLRASGVLDELSPAGVALGIVDAATFEELLTLQEYSLDEGDTLVLYTDGITEAQNAAGEEFGRERLVQQLVAQAAQDTETLFQSILEATRSFASGVPQRDDITLLMVRRTRRA